MAEAIRYDDADLDVAIRTLGGEARGEEYIGQLAVVWVMRNRMTCDPNYWGAKISRVCQKPYQFSAWNGSPDESPDLKWMLDLRKGSNAYNQLKSVVLSVFEGSMGDPTYGCTFYKRVGVAASWASGRSPRVTIGKHEFYALSPDGKALADPRMESNDEPTVA
jgi:N-acetylmuramoyl-L-alanine amidase